MMFCSSKTIYLAKNSSLIEDIIGKFHGSIHEGLMKTSQDKIHLLLEGDEKVHQRVHQKLRCLPKAQGIAESSNSSLTTTSNSK